MSAIAQTVFITVPKLISITPNRTLPKLAVKPTTDNTKLLSFNQAQGRATSPASSSGYASSDGAPPKGKKRRLDHLTWEEKIQRKKLKNRVAAQTSRDRKKARMEDMEHEIQELKDQSEILRNKCDSLISINDSLLEKNSNLDKEVGTLRQQLEDIKQQQNNSACQNCAFLGLNGSAVSKYTDPLQQGSLTKDQQNAQIPKATAQQISALWKIITLCLLYKTCSSSMSSKTSMKQTSMPIGWKSWQKACLPISQQTWKLAIARATKLLPKLQATQSACLDQWWGPQQNAWNPTDMKLEQQQEVVI